jgi:choline-glycine betaine transporter
MKISAQLAVWLCAAFALLALSVSWTSFSGLENLTDPAEREMASGYGWFWLFLAFVAVVFGLLSLAIARGKFGAIDDE